MLKLRNVANGLRGAWQGAALVIAAPGEVIEADDFAPEWFEVVEGEAAPAKVKAKPAPAKAESSAKE